MGARDKSAAVRPNGLVAFSQLFSSHFSDTGNVFVSVVLVLATCFSLGFAPPARAAQIYDQWLCTMYYSGVLGTDTVFKEVPITSIEACRAKIESLITSWWGFPVVASADPLSCSSAHCVQWFTILNPYTGRYNYAYGNAIIYYNRQFSIKLSNDAGHPASGDLAEVEPGKVTTTLRAKVYDSNNQLVPNVNLKLEVTVETYSGGHQHNVNRPRGTVNPVEGSTGPDGSGFVFTFAAPAAAGDHKITASCTGSQTCNREGPDKVWVGIKNLVTLDNFQYYVLVGDTPNHFDNHYLTQGGSFQIYALSGLYRAKYPNNPLLHLNDASLERGGLLDISTPWSPPHFEHCRGTEIDVRANDVLGAIPSTPKHIVEFRELSKVIGADAKFEIPDDSNGNPQYNLRHFHIRLLGEKPQCP